MNTRELAATATPAVPLTIEGSCVLHQMLRIRWPELRKNFRIVEEAAAALTQLESDGQSGLYSLLGHKGDLMLIHFRRSFEELSRIEFQLARLGLWECLDQTHSYLSIVELGLYDSSLKTYNSLVERGIARSGYELSRDGRPVGRVTSGTKSPSLGKSIALGYVSREAAADGKDVDVEIRGRKVRAKMVSLPFVRR